jgi:UDP-2-acetamido-3-amino-2,3-dideoxy-glucuronate N-acetyltransferase
MAVFNDTLPWSQKLCLYSHQIKWERNIPVPTKAEPEYVEIEESEPLKTECDHFLSCIAGGMQSRTDGSEGLRVLRILNASQKSLDEYGKKISFETDSKGSREKAATETKDFFVHPTSLLDKGVIVGKDSKVWHFSHVLSGSQIGERCNIGQNVVIGPDVRVGNGCKIQNNISVFKGVTLEDEVFCGPSMVFTNVHNPRAHIRRMHELRETLIKKGASLGANCTIVCGNTVGRHAFVGAGAVVTKDVPDHALVLGNPARVAGWMCECGIRLDDHYACPECGKTYGKDGEGLSPLHDN